MINLEVMMKGTEKQIAWAEDIRQQALANCDTAEYAIKTVKMTDKSDAIYQDVINQTRGFINSIGEAKNFIDNRDDLRKIFDIIGRQAERRGALRSLLIGWNRNNKQIR